VDDPKHCCWNKCKNPIAIVYLSWVLCEKHWAVIATEGKPKKNQLKNCPATLLKRIEENE